MYIDSPQSNYFQQKKSKGEKTRGQIKEEEIRKESGNSEIKYVHYSRSKC